MANLFGELKRRNVVRVGVAYAVAGWVILQVIDTLVPLLEVPEWVGRAVLIFLIAGLPVALFLSWAYELTPEGVKKTREVDADASITPSTGRKLDRMIIAVMAVAIALLVYDRMRAPGTGPETTDEPAPAASGIAAASIAVLPFADLSPGKDQDYFSDGISEELLNVLAQVPELRVAARTSSFQFKGRNLDVAEIGRQLNVTHVLEGSVRRSGTQLRITAQLIDAETGFHLWSSTYDRKFEDIFAVQDEISRAIVEALVEKLGIRAPVMAAARESVDTEAYEQYLLARQLMARQSAEGYQGALTYLERALEIAPAYAPAHAAMAKVYLTLSATESGTLPQAESTASAERHVNRALAFDSNLAEAIAVKGFIARRLGNSEDALTFFDKSLSINANQSAVQRVRSVLLFDEFNRFDEGIDANAAAVAIDPLDHFARQDLIISLAWAGRWQEAEDHLRRLERPNPFRHAYTSEILARAKGGRVDAVKISILARPLYDANNDNTMAANLARLGLHEEALETTQQKNWAFYRSIDENERALLLLESEVADNLDDEGLRSEAGRLYTFTGRFAEARAVLEPLWASQSGKITLYGIVDRDTAFALMAARRATGDAAGAAEVLDNMLAFQKLVEDASVAPDPWVSIPVALAMLLADDEEGGFRRLEKLVDSGLYHPVLENAALAGYSDDPRMVELKAAAKANRTRDRGAILEWLCVPEPPTQNLKPQPESCAEIGR